MTFASDVLLPLSSQVKARHYATLDIETKDMWLAPGNEHDGGRVGRRTHEPSQEAGFTRPFLAGFYDGETYLDWSSATCLENLLSFILRPAYSGFYFYAHYGGAFDFFHMLPCFMALDETYEVSIIPVSSTIQALIVKKGRHKWVFLDSYKLIPTSLEKAAKALQVETTKEEGFDYNTPEHDPRWKTYLERDCRALYEVVEKFHSIIEEELGGEVGMTLASTSMKTFRRGYLNRPIERASHTHALAREGYYGGNTQMFVREAKGLHCYDINSSYPAAMLGPVPVGYLGELSGKPSQMVRDSSIGILRARVYIDPALDYPPLPYRGTQGKLIHPAGSFEGVWTSEELEYAEELGCDVQWQTGHWYHTANVFADYMRALYAYRDVLAPGYSEPISYVAKLLGNTLYGKFGQNPIRERIVIIGEDEDYPLEARPANDDDDCRIFYVSEESDADYIIPQIAAVITARARLALHRFITTAAIRGGLVAYCDTDSILTTADLSDLCGGELGRLKDEGKGHTFTGAFIQPKLYRLVDEQSGEVKVRMKGFRTPEIPNASKLSEKELAKAKQDANSGMFNRAVSGEVIFREELEKLGALAQAGFKRGPLMRRVAKSIKSKDTKRVWHEDGTSSPIVLED